VLGGQATAAPQDLHTFGDPTFGKAAEVGGFDHVFELPVRRFEIPRVRVRQERTIKCRAENFQGIGYHVRGRVHDPGRIDLIIIED
jgi:hypothetical protein